jgi:hypothetical protein
LLDASVESQSGSQIVLKTSGTDSFKVYIVELNNIKDKSVLHIECDCSIYRLQEADANLTVVKKFLL